MAKTPQPPGRPINKISKVPTYFKGDIQPSGLLKKKKKKDCWYKDAICRNCSEKENLRNRQWRFRDSERSGGTWGGAEIFLRRREANSSNVFISILHHYCIHKLGMSFSISMLLH